MPPPQRPVFPQPPRLLAFILLLFLLLMLSGSAFVQINPGQQGVLMTWGAVDPVTLPPGLHFKIPMVQSVVRIDVRVQNFTAEESAASLDLQNVSTTVATNWHITADDTGWIYQNLGSESSLADKILRPIISNAAKAVTAHYNAEDLIVRRDAVRNEIEQHIIQAVKPYRIVVNSVNVTDFQFSHDYAQAIEQKQVAQQRAQQAQYDLQRAQVVAQQRIVEARAQSEAQTLIRDTITPIIVQQEAVHKWDGHLPSVVGSSNVLPMIGSLAEKAP